LFFFLCTRYFLETNDNHNKAYLQGCNTISVCLTITSGFSSTLKIAATRDLRRSIRAALFLDITSPLIFF
jgi:hypothetical protein